MYTCIDIIDKIQGTFKFRFAPSGTGSNSDISSILNIGKYMNNRDRPLVRKGGPQFVTICPPRRPGGINPNIFKIKFYRTAAWPRGVAESAKSAAVKFKSGSLPLAKRMYSTGSCRSVR